MVWFLVLFMLFLLFLMEIFCYCGRNQEALVAFYLDAESSLLCPTTDLVEQETSPDSNTQIVNRLSTTI